MTKEQEDKIMQEEITQETADNMLKALQEFNESADFFRSAFDARMKVYMDECQQAAAMKFVEYMHKYADSTFLTRWYWLRKARKCNEALKGIIQLNEEYKKTLTVMLEAKTKEQKEKVFEIFGTNARYCNFPLDFNKETDWGYEEFDDRIYLDGDITFDMMAEIVEYLREQNKESNVTWNDQRNTKQKTCKGIG